MTRIQTGTQDDQDTRYSDFMMNFDVNPITGNLARVTNENAIKMEFRNRILTNRGERFYNTNFGSNISSQLFELASPETADNIRKLILNSAKQEGRVNNVVVNIFDEHLDNAYRVEINFNIINIPELQILTIILKRTR